MLDRVINFRRAPAGLSRLPVIAINIVVLTLCTVAVPAEDPAKVDFFEKQIRPLLLQRCGKCHGAKKQESGLRVDQRDTLFRGGESGRAIQPGRPAESLLLARVLARGDQQMPPDKRLAEKEIDALKQWIADGAIWPNSMPTLPGSSRPVGTGKKRSRPLEPDDSSLADSLLLWLRADTLKQKDGEPVLVWPDASGKGHDLSITAGVRNGGTGTAPRFVTKSRVHGRPAVRFARGNGLAGSPDHPLGIRGDAAFTIILVGRLQHDPSKTYDSVLFIGNPAHQGNPGRPLSALIEIQTKEKQLDLAGGWAHDASMGPGSAQVLFDQPHVLSITHERGAWTRGTKFWFNGESSSQVWGREPTGTNQTANIQLRPEIGVALGQPMAWSGGFVGDLAEVIIFNRPLREVERAGIEAKLAIRHGLQLAGMFAEAAREFTPEEKSYWAFQAVQKPSLPAVQNDQWSSSAIDAFVLAGLEQAGLQPSPPVQRNKLIRRATLDLTGLPPTPTEVAAFVKDPREDREAFAAVVDRLLKSSHYGERWARHWLDVVRYAETTANDANAVMPYAYRYRDYVIGAFNADKPYDQFVVEQLAGDLLEGLEGTRRAEAVIATGFLMLGPKALAESDKEQSRLDIIDDQIDVMGRAFLGLTIGCARCHDHKFDPIPTVDYYSLAGIFRSTEVFRDEVRTATMWQEWSLEVPGLEPQMIMAPRETTPISLAVHVRGDRHNLGILAPRRFLQVIAGENHPPIKASGSGRLELARWIASPANPLTARVLVNRIWQHHFGSGLVHTSNNFGQRGLKPSHPRLLDWLAADFVEEGWSIKKLHRKLMISSTYMQGAGGAKAGSVDPTTIDPENRLLWKMPLRRLDAESIRDAILFISGQLDTSAGGADSSKLLYERAEVIDKKRDFFRPNRLGADDPYYVTYRKRSIYLPVVRNAVPDLMALFDGADPNGVVYKRNDTTVPSQTLFMMNHPFLLKNSRAFAQQLLSQAGANDRDLIAVAYQRALHREPQPHELNRVLGFLQELQAADSVKASENPRLEAWTSFCQTLFCRNEFLYFD